MRITNGLNCNLFSKISHFLLYLFSQRQITDKKINKYLSLADQNSTKGPISTTKYLLLSVFQLMAQMICKNKTLILLITFMITKSLKLRVKMRARDSSLFSEKRKYGRPFLKLHQMCYTKQSLSLMVLQTAHPDSLKIFKCHDQYTFCHCIF